MWCLHSPAVTTNGNVYLVSEVVLRGVPLQEDGQEGDAGGGDPGQHDHHHRGPDSYERVVDQRPGDGIISRNVQQSILLPRTAQPIM